MKKVVIMSIIGFMISILVASNVFAATNLKANVSSSVKDVKAGQEVVLKLKFDQYQEIEKGINSYKATLAYNKDVFEPIRQDNLTTLNGWEQLEYNPVTEELVAIKRAGSRIPEEVLLITLKVKEDAKPQTTEIKIKDMVTSEGKEDLFVPETSIKVNVVKEQIEEPNKPVTPVNPGQSGSDNNNNSDNSNNSNINRPGKLPNSQGNEGITGSTSNPPSNGEKGDSQDDGTTATKTFPKTGNKQRKIALMIALAVEILLIIAYVSKKKGKEIDLEINRRTKAMIATLVVSIVSLQAMGTIYAAVHNFVSKGELNDDGEINYADVNLLELHLIHKQDLPDNKLENADMNNDEQLTVTDLTLLIQKIERTLDYQVQLSDTGLENYYPNKNQDIILKFDASVSYDANVKKVVVNGQEYEVQKVEGATNEYTFKTNTGNVAGIKEYHFTEVLLDNEKRVKVDYTLRVDVLKEKPIIKNYITEENINEQKIKVSFDLEDKDNSMTSAKLEILDETEKVIQEQGIEKGHNQVEVAVPEGKKYKINVVLYYDLDSNQLQPEEDHTGMEQIIKELQMVIDYNLKITNITTKKDNQPTTTFEKNQSIQLAFESTNSTIHEPTTIKVNGKEYAVTKKDNQYMATIDAMTELGEKEIVIEEVVLGNGKKFTLENDNKTTIKVIKQKPTVTDFTSEENIAENNIKVSFMLNDEDKAMKKVILLLLDAQGKEIGREELSQEEIEKAGKIEKTLTTKVTSKYKVKVMATYNQTGVDTEDVVDSVLLEQEIKAEPRATIKEVVSNKDYVEKGETVTITYDIETNKTEAISKIRVSNTDCEVKKLENGKYEVTLTVGEDSGVQELTATKIIYSDDTMADVNHTVKVEVLKNRPSIQNYKQQDDTDHAQVTLNFDVIDEDNSIMEAKAVLTKQEDSTIKEEKEIQVGKNSITFDVENAKLYTLEVKVTYDRDTNTLEGKPEGDNRVTDEILTTKEILVLSDYELQISQIKTYQGTAESKYFQKDERITLKFESTNISKFVPIKAVINGKEYDLKKTENTYETAIDSYAEAGVKDIVIEKIILDNTKELEVTEDNQIKIEILKDKPTATKFGYTEGDDNTITVTFQINDTEQTITSGNIVITEESGKTVKTQEITTENNTVTFEKTGSESYQAKITADYDLDTNSLETGKNEVQNGILLEEEINVGDRLIEMKDIETITLYKQIQNKVSEVTKISTADLANLQPYIVKVQMKDLPEFYSTIKEYKIENGNLKFVLNYDNVVQYEGDQKRNTLEVTYGAIGDQGAENQSLEELIEQIKANPSGDFVLMKDFDASNMGSTATLIDASVTFTGTLNGNGHKIINLAKPLFNACNGATIENLVIENARMTAYGAITPSINATTIKNVHLVNPYVASPGANGTGTFVGEATGNSLIENCSATNVTVGNAKRTGGMVGKMANTTIRNCYITGRVNSGSDGSGGMVGEGFSGTTIENCYVNIETNFSWTSGSVGGMIGNPENTTLKNNLSLAQSVSGDGHGFRIKGKYQREINGASNNNYELATSNLTSNASHAAISEVDEMSVGTKEFYATTLGWSNEIWNLDHVGEGRYPTLRGADPNYVENIEEKPSNDKIYIPEYTRLKKLSNYNQQKEIVYSNLYQLMPFYDAKYLLVDGSKIAEDDILNTKIVKHILPYDKDKKLITTLTQNDNQKIASIKVIFEDDTTKDYALTFDEYKGHVASYKIEELGIGYNYNRYVIKQDATIVNKLVQYIQNLDYTHDLDPLTSEEDSRLYRDHFNQTIKTNAFEFILKWMEYGEGSIVTIENSVLNQKIENDFITSGRLKQMVYAYNYYKRWYNIDVKGTEVTDIIVVNGKLFNDSMTFDKIMNEVVASNSNRSTGGTQAFYANNIARYTGKADIGSFLDYIINTIGGYENANDWFTENYQGIVYEIPAENHPDVEYRAWRQLKRRNNYLLPFITLPKDSAFIVSSATQFLLGAQRVYISDPSNPTQKEQLLTRIKNYAVQIGNFYTTTAGFVEASRLNNATDIQVDRRTTTDGVYQTAGVTEEPFHKNFCEAVGYWAAANGSAAYANGSNVYWVAYRALDSFGTWSHESGHNQDSKIFLKGYGRRPGSGGEDYADGNITQGSGDGGENFNLSYDHDMDATVTSNLTTERINTKEKLDSYYKGMFQAIDFLDYVEAKAFLKLTPEEQSKIALQVFYPAEEAEGYDGNPTSTTYVNTGWKYLTAEQLKKMNLRTVEDLWDHRIILRPGTSNGQIEWGGRRSLWL